FLHEALAELSMLAALERIRGTAAALQLRRAMRARVGPGGPAVLGLPLARRGAARYAQDRGALLLEEVRSRLGDERFFAALREARRSRRGGTVRFAARRAALG